jgi:hypothetical protein
MTTAASQRRPELRGAIAFERVQTGGEFQSTWDVPFEFVDWGMRPPLVHQLSGPEEKRSAYERVSAPTTEIQSHSDVAGALATKV